MSILRLWPVAALGAAVLSSPVQAALPESGPYATLSGGHARNRYDVAQPDSLLAGSGATSIVSNLDRAAGSYAAHLGYQFNHNLALEGGYVSLGRNTYNASFTGGTANTVIKSSGPELSGLGMVPINDDIDVFGRAGAVATNTRSTAIVSGLANGNVLNAGERKLSPELGIGLDYGFTRSMALRAEAERVYGVGDGSRNVKGNIDLVTVGLKFAF